MSKKPNRSFDNDKKTEGKVKSLQRELKEKNKQISQLQSEVRTLQAAFKKSANYMSKESSQVSVEELIKAANKGETLEQAKRTTSANVIDPKKPGKINRPTPPTLEEIQKKKEEAREAAMKWRREKFGEYEEE